MTLIQALRLLKFKWQFPMTLAAVAIAIGLILTSGAPSKEIQATSQIVVNTGVSTVYGIADELATEFNRLNTNKIAGATLDSAKASVLITVTGEDAAAAEDAASYLAQEIAMRSNALFPEIKSSQVYPFKTEVFNKIAVPKEKKAVNKILVAGLCGLSGFLIGLIAIYIWFLSKKPVLIVEDIEKKTGLKCISIIDRKNPARCKYEIAKNLSEYANLEALDIVAINNQAADEFKRQVTESLELLSNEVGIKTNCPRLVVPPRLKENSLGAPTLTPNSSCILVLREIKDNLRNAEVLIAVSELQKSKIIGFAVLES